MNKPTRTCTIDGCNRKHYGRGYCDPHWKRWKRHGDPLAGGPAQYQSPAIALSKRTEQSGGCLLWTGALHPSGHGRMAANGKTVYAHRYAWEMENGPVPAGYEIDHECRTPSCVNVEHLRLATPSQNASHLTGAKSHNRSSGIRNVTWNKAARKWQVVVTKDQKHHYFGVFDDIDEAAEVAERARKEHFSEFAGTG